MDPSLQRTNGSRSFGNFFGSNPFEFGMEPTAILRVVTPGIKVEKPDPGLNMRENSAKTLDSRTLDFQLGYIVGSRSFPVVI